MNLKVHTAPITASDVADFSCRETLDVGGITWAYRTGEVDEAQSVSASPVLFLHGVGSSSYSYRSVVCPPY